MNQIIKITLVNLKENNNLIDVISGEPDISNPEIVREVVNTIGIGVYRSANDILSYLIPKLQKQRVLKSSDPTIHLHISGDERNVRRKIKHVMVTFMILNHENKHHHADYHYTVALYPGTEKYNTLKFMLRPFINELQSLKENGLVISGIVWKFELYFSADWKFLAICLGLNGPTDRKSTRLNSSHRCISYAVFCLKTNHRPRSASRPRVTRARLSSAATDRSSRPARRERCSGSCPIPTWATTSSRSGPATPSCSSR